MKSDKEILQIEVIGTTYTINTLTEKYDGKTKRFLQNFLPRVGTGSLAGIIGAGLVVGAVVPATLLISGTGLAIGSIIGAGAIGTVSGAGLYIGVDSISSAVQNSPKRIFKAMQKGGEDELESAIQLIKDKVSVATAYKEVLADYPDEPKIEVLPEGDVKSRKQLKKEIKSNEKVATAGVIALLEEAMSLTESLRKIYKKINQGARLSDREESNKKNYELKLDKINECIKFVATSTKEKNPYKEAIIDAMLRGCWLGNYNQNQEIDKLKTTKNKHNALQLYYQMFERGIVRPEPVKRQVDEDLYSDALEQNRTLTAEKQQLEQQLQLSEQKRKRTIQTGWNQRGKKKQLQKANEQLEQQLQSSEQQLRISERKRKSALRVAQKKTEINKALQTQLEKAQKGYARGIQTAVDQRDKRKYWQQRAESSEQVLEAVYGNLTERERLIGRLVEEKQKILQETGEEAEQLEKFIEDLESEIESLEKQNSRLVVDRQRSDRLAEDLGWDLHKTRRELEKISADAEVLSDAIDELIDERNVLAQQQEETMEAQSLELAKLEGEKALNKENWLRGGKVHVLDSNISRIEAHIEYSRQQGTFDEEIVRGLESAIKRVRNKNLTALTKEEIKQLSDALRGFYQKSKPGLARISDKRLRQFQQDLNNQHNL